MQSPEKLFLLLCFSCYFLLCVIVIPHISWYFLQVCLSAANEPTPPPFPLFHSCSISTFCSFSPPPLVLHPPLFLAISNFGVCVCVSVCTVVKSCSSYEVISHMVSLYFACNGKCSLPETPLCQLPTLVLLLTFLCVYSPSFFLFHPFALILFPFIIPLNSSHSSFNLPPVLLSTFSFPPSVIFYFLISPASLMQPTLLSL